MKPQIVYLLTAELEDGGEQTVAVYAEYETAKATAEAWTRDDGVAKYGVVAREVRVTRQ